MERFLHFSEIGVAVDHPSKRLASKAKGDALVREITPNATIVRWEGATTGRGWRECCGKSWLQSNN